MPDKRTLERARRKARRAGVPLAGKGKRTKKRSRLDACIAAGTSPLGVAPRAFAAVQEGSAYSRRASVKSRQLFHEV